MDRAKRFVYNYRTMSLFTEPNEAEWAALHDRDNWVEAVLALEYGEAEAPEGESLPKELNWLTQVPVDLRFDFDSVECSLAFVSEDGSYSCTLWDVSGEEDVPWVSLLVDVYGARVLTEYSLLEEDDSEVLDSVLDRATRELPKRLEGGEFTRSGTPLVIPEWVRAIEENLWTEIF